MKKVLTFLFGLICVFSFAFAIKTNVKADALSTDSNITIVGASVRTTGNPGLRFTGSIGSYVIPDGLSIEKYGICLVPGSDEASSDFAISGTVNGKSVINAEVDERDGSGYFHVVLWGIPSSAYIQDINARAYVRLSNGTIVYGSVATARSLGYVASRAYNDSDEYVGSGNLVDTVATSLKVKLDLSGGTRSFYYTDFTTEFNSKLADSATVTLRAGTYNTNLAINVDNLTIEGPNKDVSGSGVRGSEAIVTSTFTLESTVVGLTINGLKFFGNAQIVSTSSDVGAAGTYYANQDFTFKYNYVDKDTSNSSFINFANGDRRYTKNAVLSNNYFTAPNQTASETSGLVYIRNSDDLTIQDNIFNNIKGNAVAIFDSDNAKGVGGNLYINRNQFKTITNSALYFNWFNLIDDLEGTPLSPARSHTIDISYNYFEKISCSNPGGVACIDFENSSINIEYTSSSIHHNVFREVEKCLWAPRFKNDTLHFNDNVIYQATSITYVAKASLGHSYTFDCAQNIYLSTDGKSIISTTNYSGWFNARATDYTTNGNYDTKEEIKAYKDSNPLIAAYMTTIPS